MPGKVAASLRQVVRKQSALAAPGVQRLVLQIVALVQCQQLLRRRQVARVRRLRR